MTTEIPTASVIVHQRRRSLSSEKVRELASSMDEIGLLNPITVTEQRVLVAGLHRLEAARLLEWETIAATVVDLDADGLELAEIDENLIRNELAVLERGEHLARRQAIYERLHPETTHGSAEQMQAVRRGEIISSRQQSFAADTAARTGLSERTVQQETKIGRDIVEDVRDAVRETPIADRKVTLLELSRLEPVQQREVGNLVKSGADARTVDDAIAARKRDPALGQAQAARSTAPTDTAPLSHQAGYDSDEWYTPAEHIEAVRQVLGAIDLDPASCATAQASINARAFYTKADDGLAKEWRGRVWLNPPYSQPAATQFADKLLAEIDAGRVTEAIMVQNASTDTGWFHRLAQRSAVCLTRGRINFNRQDGESSANRYGQAFFYFGKNASRFGDVFGAFGLVGTLRSRSNG